MEKKNKHGGARIRAGAPKKDDKLKQFQVSIRESVINKHGGKEVVLQLIKKIIIEYFK